MGIGAILLSPTFFFPSPILVQLTLNHPPCCPPTHAHLPSGPQGCFVPHWNVCVELCVQPPPNLHHAHCAKSQSPCICTLALEASCLVGALTMCPPPPINLRQHSTLHLHLCTHSEPGCTATFGCACPSIFPIAWRTFHHKPALVASIILWLEYFLCAHHTNFPSFQLLGTCMDLLFCLPGPSWFAHHLAHPSAHLCCRWDISLVSNAPIGTGFGPQNITVITSQESHHWHAFFDQICRNSFSIFPRN